MEVILSPKEEAILAQIARRRAPFRMIEGKRLANPKNPYVSDRDLSQITKILELYIKNLGGNIYAPNGKVLPNKELLDLALREIEEVYRHEAIIAGQEVTQPDGDNRISGYEAVRLTALVVDTSNCLAHYFRDKIGDKDLGNDFFALKSSIMHYYINKCMHNGLICNITFDVEEDAYLLSSFIPDIGEVGWHFVKDEQKGFDRTWDDAFVLSHRGMTNSGLHDLRDKWSGFGTGKSPEIHDGAKLLRDFSKKTMFPSYTKEAIAWQDFRGVLGKEVAENLAGDSRGGNPEI